MKLFKKIKKIYIASDHAGYPLKQVIVKEFLSKKGINFQDLGTNSEKSVDYPKFAKKLSKKINKTSMGILICGSGIGVSISANRHKHIRASLCHNVNSAKMTRKHNDSNSFLDGTLFQAALFRLRLISRLARSDSWTIIKETFMRSRLAQVGLRQPH